MVCTHNSRPDTEFDRCYNDSSISTVAMVYQQLFIMARYYRKDVGLLPLEDGCFAGLDPRLFPV